MSIYLQLFHGRKDPNRELQDWGDEGPIFGPLQYVHTTYAHEIKFCYDNSAEHEGWLTVTNDLLYYDGVFYGDWTTFTELPTTYEKMIVQFEKTKARLPEGTAQQQPWYILLLHGGIEPELIGPFTSAEERDARAQELRKKNDEDVILQLDSTSPAINVTAYSAGFLSGEFS